MTLCNNPSSAAGTDHHIENYLRVFCAVGEGLLQTKKLPDFLDWEALILYLRILEESFYFFISSGLGIPLVYIFGLNLIFFKKVIKYFSLDLALLISSLSERNLTAGVS